MISEKIKNKWLIFFLISLTLFKILTIINNKLDEIESNFYTKRLYIEKLNKIISLRERIEKAYIESQKIDSENRKFIFTNSSRTSVISSFQDFLDKTSKKCKVKIISIRWAPSYTKSNIEFIPCLMELEGKPKNVGIFLCELANWHKIVILDSLSCSSSSESIYTNIHLSLVRYLQ